METSQEKLQEIGDFVSESVSMVLDYIVQNDKLASNLDLELFAGGFTKLFAKSILEITGMESSDHRAIMFMGHIIENRWKNFGFAIGIRKEWNFKDIDSKHLEDMLKHFDDEQQDIIRAELAKRKGETVV